MTRAYQKALQLWTKKGYTLIHPFDDENVIAGQGTIGLEILDQLPDADAVVPVGGGGFGRRCICDQISKSKYQRHTVCKQAAPEYGGFSGTSSD